jgi:hypothetical protein
MAQYQCVGGASGSGPNGLTCVQTVGPQPELCNGFDDDCDGTPDNNLVDPAVGVMGGAPCPALPAGQMQPPCSPGVTACVNGAVVCQGFVGPQANLCDGVSRDCTGMVNTAGNCPSGFSCVDGNCLTACTSGEFPCPGGFVCDTQSNLCKPDACFNVTCAQGTFCKQDKQGNAKCVDPCEDVTCPQGYRCKQGLCEDDSCRIFGCPDGQLCVGVPPECKPDLCANKVCDSNQFCDPASGDCVAACLTACATGDCKNGVCQDSPCDQTKCLSGQACAVVGGMGVCHEDLCSQGCNPGLICCGGACAPDPCVNIHCPGGTACVADSGCGPTCQGLAAGKKDQVAAAGGGGFGCQISGGRSSPPALAFLLVALALLWRRRTPNPARAARRIARGSRS